MNKKPKIHKSAKIYENVFILGNSVIKKNTIIYPGTTILNSIIEENCIIKSSHIENCVIKKNCSIGPFAHIKQNSLIFENCRIGNFVEIKNSSIGKHTKIAHLSYVGDAQIGDFVNIGCGVVCCNYNGKTKSKTVIGNHSFIGSNCNLIAPINIAENTFIAAGTTLTKNTTKNDFVIGRSKEVIKPNLAQKYLKEESVCQNFLEPTE